MKHALFLLLLTGSSVLAGHDLSRYEMIISRSPFGREPLPEPGSSTGKAAEIAGQYRLCMLYENASGQLKAGVVNKTDNKSLLLQVGESDQGLTLMEVQLEEGVAVLQQNGETIRLVLEGLAAPGLPPATQVAAADAQNGTIVNSSVLSARQTTQGSLLLQKPDDRTVLIGRPRIALKNKTQGSQLTDDSAAGRVFPEGGGQVAESGAESGPLDEKAEKMNKILSRPFSFQQASGLQAGRLGVKQ